MSKFLKIGFTVLVLLVIGYAFAYKHARIRNNFSNSSNDATAAATAAVADVRGSTQIGSIVNNYNAGLNFRVQATGHTYVVAFPQKLVGGQQSQYVLILPYAKSNNGSDKIVVSVTSASHNLICNLTIASAGDGAAQFSASDNQSCSVSASGDLVIANSKA